MSGVRWEWRDGGSGPGHLQLVANSQAFNRIQRAYRVYLGHTRHCPRCLEELCPVGIRLRRGWQAAKSP